MPFLTPEEPLERDAAPWLAARDCSDLLVPSGDVSALVMVLAAITL